MMRFKYPLQKILDLKGNEKMQAEWMLADAIGKLQSQELSLEQWKNERGRAYQLLQQQIDQSITIQQMQLLNEYIVHLDRLIEHKKIEVKQAAKQVDQEQQYVTIKSMDVKVWEKSKQKAMELFTFESLKREQNQLDEMATIRFVNQ